MSLKAKAREIIEKENPPSLPSSPANSNHIRTPMFNQTSLGRRMANNKDEFPYFRAPPATNISATLRVPDVLGPLNSMNSLGVRLE